MESSHLAYADERDRCYGATGMAITLVALDGEKYLYRLNIDAPDSSDIVAMSTEFGMKANPRISAKIIWEQMLTELRLVTSMAMGNLACRRYILNHTQLSSRDMQMLRQAFDADAGSYCELDADELDSLFNSCFSYVDRVFRHNGIHDIAHRFAARLAERRELSGTEALEILAAMGLS